MEWCCHEGVYLVWNDVQVGLLCQTTSELIPGPGFSYRTLYCSHDSTSSVSGFNVVADQCWSLLTVQIERILPSDSSGAPEYVIRLGTMNNKLVCCQSGYIIDGTVWCICIVRDYTEHPVDCSGCTGNLFLVKEFPPLLWVVNLEPTVEMINERVTSNLGEKKNRPMQLLCVEKDPAQQS